MKTTYQLLFAAALTAFGAAATAQEWTPDPEVNVPLTKSREQVLAELQQARLDGTINASADNYVAPFKSVRTREEVRAEVVAARESGELEALQREYDGDRFARVTFNRTAREAVQRDSRVSSVQPAPGQSTSAQ